MLPSGPLTGDHVRAMALILLLSAKPITRAMTSAWTAGSLTTPFFPTFSRPASTYGLIRQTMSLPGTESFLTTGSTRESEMKETSIDTKEGR